MKCYKFICKFSENGICTKDNSNCDYDSFYNQTCHFDVGAKLLPDDSLDGFMLTCQLACNHYNSCDET